MSAFLGHIHYWLYRKIQLLVERENLILQAGYWRTAGVDPKFMALAYQTWFEAFVKAIDPVFELVTTEENGTRLYTIKKK
ncbi:MAG: hypothetical protein E6246_05770 [Veillonella sp.]|nr:hypothetical protein [Veillonella sp.]